MLSDAFVAYAGDTRHDPRVGINWPVKPLHINERDRTYPDFDETTFDG